MEANATFIDVAGQLVTAPRPPAKYVTVIDTYGVSCPVSKDILSASAMGRAILDLLVKHGDAE